MPDAIADRPTGFLLRSAHRRVQRAANQDLRAIGIDLRGLGVLGALARSGPLTQRQLIEAGDLDKTSMVLLLDRLQREGLVIRRPAPNDRRAHAVHVTGAGRRRLAEGHGIAVAAQERVLAPLGAADRRELDRMLRAIVDEPT